ncbi:Ig-like domain-containing protein [Nocardiopsis aegyptia]|uniref:Ig-like domain-containing protein n=1 Tax=Nocardiopsis aegyptia TaxID=220378 RepID=UPI00366A733A
MALDDDALLVAAVGTYYFHPTVGTEPPADPDNPQADGYVDLGHTALEAPFAINSEGGEQTVLGTWRNRQARSINSPRVESFAFVLNQWTEYNYRLYFGANVITDANGYTYAHQNPVETEGTLWVRIDDGDERVAFHAFRVSIFRNEALALEAEALGGLSVRATVLGRSGDQRLYGLTAKAAALADVVGLTVTPATSNLAAAGTEQLAAEALHDDASTSDVTLAAAWGTSDEEVATVSSSGLVTAVAAGSAVITAMYQGHTDTCDVTVT